MSKVTTTITLYKEYADVKIETKNYSHTMQIDKEEIQKLDCLKISNTGYAYTSGISVSHLVMNHISNMKTVIDHIDGNKLNNRKYNLRVVTQHQNSQHKTTFIRNNTGAVGISFRKNGNYEYYRVSLTDRHDGIKSNRQGKRITKQFNINKLGKTVAFLKATEFLRKKKMELGYLI